jgi:tRNA-splicing ligase RtcB (3'-phosphate/5'-hydroxy nucleic acid ligase)
MVESSLLPPLYAWLVNPLDGEVHNAIERLRRAPDVQHVAVMPDVHLAGDVCIGVAIGTKHLIYPQAVGGDIGCGVLAVPFDVSADRLAEPAIAGRVLAKLASAVPARRWNRKLTREPPHDVASDTLSDPRLDAVWRKQGTLELATLGSGNHFAELQVDGEGRLWLMVHSGSRAMGPAIRDFHLERAEVAGSSGLRALDANSVQGRAYLHDMAWARRYAAANRQQIAMNIGTILAATISATLQWDLAITTDHNHVESEPHSGSAFWVHRKGAMAAAHEQQGALPGSMGTASFHVQGRGCSQALCSSAHGAGRLMSRTAARRSVTTHELQRQMAGIWYDYRHAEQLRDEAPSAYKDIRAVARAQRELVKIVRVLRPVLNYKGI